MPTLSSLVYSLQMKQTALLNLLIGAFIVETGFVLIENGTSTKPGMAWRIGFFILMPLALGVLIWLRFRWAAMACVIYATVGLALDIATIIQAVTKDSEVGVSLIANVISGLFNFLLIVFGGRSFLDVGPVPMPRESRPPNPPSPS
ncbi:MAG: hypothetical protein NTAFB01_10120 [Nitrospira sp.]